MGKLIDADDLNIEICKHKGCFATGEGNEPFMAWEVEDYINDALAVDAVPVVRCRNCRYFEPKGPYNDGIGRCDHPNLDYDVECYDQWINTKPDDFCSCGERKEDKK